MSLHVNHIKFDLAIYHGGCPDGITAAWAFRHCFPEIQIQGYRYGQSPPDVEGRNVAVLDFSFSRTETIEMFQKANYMIVLDHHDSAQKNLENLNQIIDPKKGKVIFDMKRAGAQIAWDYLFPNQKRHWLIEYVADRDLWKKELPYTEELSFALWFDGYFNDIVRLGNLIEKVPTLSSNLGKQPIVQRGKDLIKCKAQDVKSYTLLAVPAVFKIKDQSYNVRIVCCPRQYRSDVGNAIVNKFSEIDFSAIYWYDHFNDEWWISFRGSKNCKYNLGEITNQLPTGGGHPQAAGFTIKKGHLNDYFEIPQPSVVTLSPILLPLMKDYIKKELTGYLRASKETNFMINNLSLKAKLTCAPNHYHSMVLEKMLKGNPDIPIVGAFWYDFGRQLWEVKIMTKSLNLLDLLGPYPEGSLKVTPECLISSVLTWVIDETSGLNLKTFFSPKA